jgi:predicted ATPase
MIDRLILEGYRSFKQLDIELKPLNVLIGPNASGKSNLIDFFELMSEAADRHLADAVARRDGMSELLWAGGAEKLQVRLEFAADALAQSLGAPHVRGRDRRPAGGPLGHHR